MTRPRSKGNIDRPTAHRWPDLTPRGVMSDRLADVIRSQIMTRVVADGAPLPSISKLRDRYGASARTVLQAFRVLVAEGYVERAVPDTHGFYAHLARVPGVGGCTSWRMIRPARVTDALLIVLRELLAADGGEVYGWQISMATGLDGRTVHGILGRLRDGAWVTDRWESSYEAQEPAKPRRRFYRLTEHGQMQAQALVAERA